MPSHALHWHPHSLPVPAVACLSCPTPLLTYIYIYFFSHSLSLWAHRDSLVPRITWPSLAQQSFQMNNRSSPATSHSQGITNIQLNTIQLVLNTQHVQTVIMIEKYFSWYNTLEKQVKYSGLHRTWWRHLPYNCLIWPAAVCLYSQWRLPGKVCVCNSKILCM